MNRKIIRVTIKTKLENESVLSISNAIADLLRSHPRKLRFEVYDDTNSLLIKNK